MLGPRSPDTAVVAGMREQADHDPHDRWNETTAGGRVTGIETVACWLYEPDGALLSAGLVQRWDPGAACRVRVVGLDWPGQVIQRCLVGDVREVCLELEWGTRLPARVEEVRFDPALGRTCELHLTSVCCEPAVDAAIASQPEPDPPLASPRPGTVGAT